MLVIRVARHGEGDGIVPGNSSVVPTVLDLIDGRLQRPNRVGSTAETSVATFQLARATSTKGGGHTALSSPWWGWSFAAAASPCAFGLFVDPGELTDENELVGECCSSACECQQDATV